MDDINTMNLSNFRWLRNYKSIKIINYNLI